MPKPFKSKKGFAEIFSMKQRLSQETDLRKYFHWFWHVQREKSNLTKLVKQIYKIKLQHNVLLQKNFPKLILRKIQSCQIYPEDHIQRFITSL